MLFIRFLFFVPCLIISTFMCMCVVFFLYRLVSASILIRQRETRKDSNRAIFRRFLVIRAFFLYLIKIRLQSKAALKIRVNYRTCVCIVCFQNVCQIFSLILQYQFSTLTKEFLARVELKSYKTIKKVI